MVHLDAARTSHAPHQHAAAQSALHHFRSARPPIGVLPREEPVASLYES